MTGPIPETWAVDPERAGARPVTDGVWRLRLPTSWPGVDHANAYLVALEDGVMLVDTGPGGDPSNLAALERAVGQAGFALTDVRALVLTHAHSDHVGVANAIREASGAEVWLHPDTEHLYRAIREPDPVRERRARSARREGVPDAWLDDFASVEEEVGSGGGQLHVDHELVPGVAVPSALGDWQVVAAPGHAPSQVVLVQPEHRVAIVGDSLCIVFGASMDYGWSPDPVQEWRDTLDAIEGLGDLDFALPGHGRPLTELAPVLADHRDGLDALLASTRNALAAGPATAFELQERVHGETRDGIVAIVQATALLCALKHLRVREEVVRAEAADGTFTYRLRGEGHT